MGKTLIKNIQTLYQAGEDLPTMLRGEQMAHVPVIHDAFVAIEEGKIVAYGKMTDLIGIDDWSNLTVIDATGKSVIPAFCDAHTHLVFAKTREEEFVDRIKGLSYEEIALKGGGILNSARRLNEMPEDELYEHAVTRIHQVMSYGTGAIEIKSGYGLTVEAELKMLRVIKRLKESMPIAVKATFLGAHAFPKEYKENRRGYIDMIVNEMLPQVTKEQLADYIDVFCERNYFSVEEMEEILIAGKLFGLTPKVHVNQFSVMGGVRKAIECGALSVDHLEEIADDDLLALKESNCMPIALPGCSHFLSIPFTDARRIIGTGLPLALASDYNPGSTPSGNLSVVWSLACIKMKMTPEEALNALTINAAYAMGLENSHGRIALGYSAPVLITSEIPSLALIPYSFGDQLIEQVVC
jgi:imidazolonepropionase